MHASSEIVMIISHKRIPLVALLLLAGCTQVQVKPVMLPVPVEPALTPVTASQVQCLAPQTYTALVNRERALRTWALELQAVIDANNAKAQ